ncbi:GMC family oxidoreductase [Nocardia vaccinii]|uniref:GMC family oxidoreductase n=1 Tax=Nocardia vaccinii TaxID=1822 RepID=UPI00082B9D0E|nr:GMC family oxidoreductase N-terminal domain-containing protein [Nocardia vaccinii]
MKDKFDYIIVGSGAAGCVLAERLSESGRDAVLVLEAGGWDRNPLHLVPKGFYFTMSNPRYTKVFTTDEFGDDTQRESWARGRVIGGSTTINGSVWNRGWADDYDSWAERGVTGWGWEAFLEAFKAMENNEFGRNGIRGGSGPVRISPAGPAEPVSDAFLESLGEFDVPTLTDVNSGGGDRAGYVMSSVSNGTRVSAARAFLHPARKRLNCTVAPNHQVGRIVFDGNHAVGVQARVGGRAVTYRARKEVLICGGALDTPLLLERSGVGRADVLAAAGVPIVVESPNVGENLREHRGIRMQFHLEKGLGYNARIDGKFRQGLEGARYLAARDGIMSFGGYSVVALYRSDPDSTRPDTQTLFTPISTSGMSPSKARLVVDDKPGAMLLTNPLYPKSRGSIHISGPVPEDAPAIEPCFFSDERDRRLMVASFRKAREIMRSAPIAGMVIDEFTPGRRIQSDEEILSYALNQGSNSYHTLGTCAVGGDGASVVDDHLRVRGITGLRVVDASVFPEMPSGNNSAPTQALAYIAAQKIRADND